MKRSSYVETGSLGTKERNKETRSEIKVFATGLQNKNIEAKRRGNGEEKRDDKRTRLSQESLTKVSSSVQRELSLSSRFIGAHVRNLLEGNVLLLGKILNEGNEIEE